MSRGKLPRLIFTFLGNLTVAFSFASLREGESGARDTGVAVTKFNRVYGRESVVMHVLVFR